MNRNEKRKRLSYYRRYSDRIAELTENIVRAEAAAEKTTPSNGPGGLGGGSKVENGVLSMLESSKELETLQALREAEKNYILSIAGGIKFGSVIIDYYLKSYTVPEIAGKYKISVSAAEKRLRKAIDRIHFE